MSSGDRYNQGKPGMHLLPMDALMEIAKVFDYGSIKYSSHNWERGLKWDEGIKASLLRHLAQWSTGEYADGESGLPHDIHIAFNAIALVTMRLRGIGEDDRFTNTTVDNRNDDSSTRLQPKT